MSNKILLIEDDPSQRKMIATLLKRRLGHTTIEADSGETALGLLRGDQEKSIQLVILDLHMPGMDGMEVLEIIMQQYPHLPVIMLTGTQDVDVAVEAMKRGAKDFLNKPPEPERLQISIQNALKLSVLEKEVSRLKRKEEGAFTFDNLIGYDSGLTDVVKIGRKATSADIPVLLTGETGVGKEVFARAIHGESHRVGKAFVAVNCGAIPEQLVESTLFGHEKGAFTGAVTKAIGKFREADGGTIFLDEVGELPLDAQVKLLRILQQKEVSPVGGTGAVPVNVRIISATNRDLEIEVAEGRFRDDLYFRLNVLPIKLPSIRERTEDIPELIHHFIERFAASEDRSLKDVSSEAIDMLSGWEWAGNVREIENTIHRAMILSDNEILEVDDFSALPTAAFSSLENNIFSEEQIGLFGPDGNLKSLEDIEYEAIQFSLSHHKNNITQAASALGVAKSTFYRKLKEMGA